MTKRKTGTREWSEHSANLFTGCANDCRYCYARADALRFGRIKRREDWREMRFCARVWAARVRKRAGVTMFPTAHDIMPETADACACYLAALLKAGNEVVLVSKPNPTAMKILLARIFSGRGDWHSRLLFRFTIGASDDRLLKYWEPRAPSFAERMHALIMVHGEGWRTSVSMEPLLTDDPRRLVEMVEPFVTDDIWIGKMNHVRRRVRVMSEEDRDQVRRIELMQTDERIMEIVEELNCNPLVVWKDSIQEVIERNGLTMDHGR